MKPVTRRYADLVFLYSMDFSQDVIARQRIYKVTVDSQTLEIETIITPLFLQRVITDVDSISVPKANAFNFEPRHLMVCLENRFNLRGFSEFKCLIPYRPTDSNHKNHVQEILTDSRVFSGKYFGEEHTKIP